MARDLSLYLHIPYCTVRCGYCDFNTYTPSELNSELGMKELTQSYIDTLISEVDLVIKEVGTGLNVPTIFIGGGTPSLVSPDSYQKLFKKLKEVFYLPADLEVTMEANPDSLTGDNLAQYRDIGINRLSLGYQSSAKSVLQVLNRTHNPDNVGASVELAQRAGFAHINLDLIYGTPGETMEQWQESLTFATSLPVDHISAYALIVEAGTKLAREIAAGIYQNPDDDLSADKYLWADQYLTKLGFNWYELSNWAKPGGECRHNLAYWSEREWWGLGPGAHSYFDNRRFWNVKNPRTYANLLAGNNLPIAGEELLTSEDKQLEKLMLEIRLRTGIEIAQLNSRQQEILETLEPKFFLSDGLAAGRLILSPAGRLMADYVVKQLSIFG